MVREKDVCWEYCEKLEGNKVKCKFCLRILNGGISRLKHHLSRLPSKGVHPCAKVREDVTNRVRAIIAAKEEGKEASTAKKQRLAEVKSPGNVSSNKQPLLYIEPPPITKYLPSNPSPGRSSPFERESAERSIALFFFENKIEISIARSPSYQLMVDAVSKCGPGFRGPSSEALRTTWLQRIKSEVSQQSKDIEKEWGTTGCTIIAETWTDNKSRAIINFLISSPSGTFFHKSVDASMYFKNTKCLSDLFESVIQDLGAENVVQIIVDNALNYVGVGNHIIQNYSTIFWSPCASHCLNFILEDFCEIDWVSRCILQAQSISKFIYNHSWVLDLMKKFTGQELVRTSITRVTSNFLSLQSLLKLKQRLKHMFKSPEYTSSQYANKPQSLECISILEDNEFLRSLDEIVGASEPLLKVLREVIGGKPAVGSIYESMAKAKESIRSYFIMDESKRKTFIDIVDRRWQKQLHSPLHSAAAFLNPGIQYFQDQKFLAEIKPDFIHVLEKLLPTPEQRQDITKQIVAFKKAEGMFGCNLAIEARNTVSPGLWWEQYGDTSPTLQWVAVRILSQVCCVSTFERNWSSFQQIHSEKRNRLDKETLNDLLYISYNMKLATRTKGKLAELDPLMVDDIDMTSDWVETENSNQTQWLDSFSSMDTGSNLNTRQFNNSIFSTNDHIFGL